jgi:hypothetical protein
MTDEERIPDEFETAARVWAAQEELIEISASFVEHFDLDPEMLEDLREAYKLSEDWEWKEDEEDASPFFVALTELLEAVLAARDEQQGREGG